MGDFYKLDEKNRIKFADPAVNTFEEIDAHIQTVGAKEVSFDHETYKVIYNEEQTKELTADVLKSDRALEDYYKKHDESKLQGLRSKSFLNLSGKKSERKKLRKGYLDSIREKTRSIGL